MIDKSTILEFFNASPAKTIAEKDLLQRLQIESDQRHEFKRQLRDLIASGEIVDFGQTAPWPRHAMNATPIVFKNAVAYTSYQLLFPSIRGEPGEPGVVAMQTADIELVGKMAN